MILTRILHSGAHITPGEASDDGFYRAACQVTDAVCPAALRGLIEMKEVTDLAVPPRGESRVLCDAFALPFRSGLFGTWLRVCSGPDSASPRRR